MNKNSNNIIIVMKQSKNTKSNRKTLAASIAQLSSTYFSTNGFLFLEFFFSFAQSFVKPSRTVFPLFQKLLLTFLKLWDLSHDAVVKRSVNKHKGKCTNVLEGYVWSVKVWKYLI